MTTPTTPDRRADARSAPDDGTFDAAARRAHAASLEGLSPRVRAQLAQRRRAATGARAPAGVRAWPLLAIGGSAAVALIAGVLFLRAPVQEAAHAPTPAVAEAPQAALAPTNADTAAPNIAPTVAPVEVAHVDRTPRTAAPAAGVLPADWTADDYEAAQTADGIAAIDESPDFYLWLAANEGQADLTETL